MKVTPRKVRPLDSGELRVIRIPREAVEELLWEHLMEHQADYFDAPSLDEKSICLMQWKGGDLTYALAPIKAMMGGKEPDFSVICKKSGKTTTSLFHPKRYKRLKLTLDMFK